MNSLIRIVKNGRSKREKEKKKEKEKKGEKN